MEGEIMVQEISQLIRQEINLKRKDSGVFSSLFFLNRIESRKI
jgi:hypothetical protein